MSGPGRFEILGKYAQARFLGPLDPIETQKTSEFNLNYVLKQFNARLMIFYQDTRFDLVPDGRRLEGRRRAAAPDVSLTRRRAPQIPCRVSAFPSTQEEP